MIDIGIEGVAVVGRDKIENPMEASPPQPKARFLGVSVSGIDTGSADDVIVLWDGPDVCDAS